MINKVIDFKSKDSSIVKYISIGYSTFSASLENSYFDEWLEVFKYSHGELDTQRKLDLVKLSNYYDIKIESSTDVFKFIYCLESFYTLVLNFICWKSLNKSLSNEDIEYILQNKFFERFNITNFYTPDYLLHLSNSKALRKSIETLATEINTFDSSIYTHDFLKDIFHEVYPREIRHSLGEFYTPDWLASYLVNCNLELTGLSTSTVLDPTCGSGTFLFNYLKVVGWSKNAFDSVRGFDINPVSTLAAKVNYLLLLNERVGSHEEFLTIPIFNSNVLTIQSEEEEKLRNLFHIANFQDYLKLFEETLYDSHLRSEIASIFDTKNVSVSNIFKLLESVAPLFIDKVDIILGNPPWVNWEYLPEDYKKQFSKLWLDYNLFDHKGMNAAFIKEDISALITYVSIDKFLKPNGIISFIVKESLFKSTKQAKGFRQFSSAKKETCVFSVLKVDDLTNFNPFPDVTNNTVIFHAKKGSVTKYPVDYFVWKLKVPASEIYSKNIFDSKLFSIEQKLAMPVVQSDYASGWITVSKELYPQLPALLGQNSYKARIGVFTGGANGIYWLKATGKVENNLIEVENIVEKAKIKFTKIKVLIEDKFLYPYMSGSNLNMWEYSYDKYIICPHTYLTKMHPVDKIQLSETPKTKEYFDFFAEELASRKGFTSLDKAIHEKYFYTLQRIGDYTFKPYKVAWRYISSTFICAVIEDTTDKLLGLKTIIPNEKIVYLGFDEPEEAYYLCGILSSNIFREVINSFTVETQIAPSTIEKLNIPTFDKENDIHLRISKVCRQGHYNKNFKECIEEINNLVIEMFNMNPMEVSQINILAIPAFIPPDTTLS